MKFQQRTIKLITDVQKNNAIQAINNTPTGINLEIVIRESPKIRNNDQNALMWAVLGDISAQYWVNKQLFSADTWHRHLKQEFLPDETKVPNIAELVTKPDIYRKWDFLPSNERVLVGSTTDLTKKGFSEYMEQIFAFAISGGVVFEIDAA